MNLGTPRETLLVDPDGSVHYCDHESCTEPMQQSRPVHLSGQPRLIDAILGQSQGERKK